MDLRLKSEEQISITSSSSSTVYLSVPGKGRGAREEERRGPSGRREAARLVARSGLCSPFMCLGKYMLLVIQLLQTLQEFVAGMESCTARRGWTLLTPWTN